MKKIFFYLSIFYLLCLLCGMITNEFLGKDLYYKQNILNILEVPSWTFWFGTDSLGRDLLARTLHGGKNSILIGVISAFCGTMIGVLMGSVCALGRGIVDRLILRWIDLFSAIPSFMLVSALALFFQSQKFSNWSQFIVLILSISLSNWMYIARIMRGKVLAQFNEPYIEAARGIGLSPLQILWSHILPNASSQIIILFAMQIPLNIIFESMVSFIGLGILPPESSLGLLIREGWRYLMNFPHLLLVPSLMMFLTIWSFHVILDHLYLGGDFGNQQNGLMRKEEVGNQYN